MNLKLKLATLCCAVMALAAPSAFAQTNAQTRYEIRFMTNMIDHHMMAVEMARLCEDRADHQELLDMCAEIESVQLQEIETMQEWLLDWYGVEYEPQMTPGMMAQMEAMAELDGAEFEIAFMTGMIRHHWRAVVESRHCQRMAYHQELIDMCEEIETAQMEEIATLQDWLCDWYQICGYGPNVGAHSHH